MKKEKEKEKKKKRKREKKRKRKKEKKHLTKFNMKFNEFAFTATARKRPKSTFF